MNPLEILRNADPAKQIQNQTLDDRDERLLHDILHSETATADAVQPIGSVASRPRAANRNRKPVLVTAFVAVVVAAAAVVTIQAAHVASTGPVAATPTSGTRSLEDDVYARLSEVATGDVPVREKSALTWTEASRSPDGDGIDTAGKTLYLAAACDGGGSIAIRETGRPDTTLACDVRSSLGPIDISPSSTKAASASLDIVTLSGHPRYVVKSMAFAEPTSTPTPTNSFAALPPPAPAPTSAALRSAFGQGCTSTTATMPSTKFKATIGDVDGDGRPDTEWALIGTRGLVWGVTTAAGATIEETDAFASGGSRSVSIGTLATGQTIALPSDGHTDALRVLHDCRWVTPKASGEKGAFNFTSAYDSPVDSAIGTGGECVGGRLYQVFTDESTDPNQQTAVPETVAAGGATVTTAHTRLRLTPSPSTSSSGPPTYGEQCLPSEVLTPVYKQ